MSSSAAPGFIVDSLLAALNHVLAQHPESALPKLRGHQGALVFVETVLGDSTWNAPVRVGADGFLVRDAAQPAPIAESPPERPRLKITVPVKLDHISTWSNQGFAGLMRQVRIEGDVDLASTIGHLMKEVRWDAEEDLSKIVGDAAAHRIGQGARSFTAQAKEWSEHTRSTAQQKISVGADAPLVGKTEFVEWQAHLRELRDAVDRLDQRVSFVKKNK